MTAEDLHTWKLQRAVRLYRVEDLGVTLISERLGLATRSIYQALAEAGLEAKHEKRLPAGLPVA
jgi:DNA-binding transcriptional regulator LsrR (DeoR family)